MTDLLETLRSHSMMKEIGEQELVFIAGLSRPVSHSAGRVICRKDEPARDLLLLCRGRVAIEAVPSTRGSCSMCSFRCWRGGRLRFGTSPFAWLASGRG